MNNTLNAIEKPRLKGWTEIRHFDTLKMRSLLVKEGVTLPADFIDFRELCSLALKSGVSAERLFELLDKSAKPLFQPNKLWIKLKEFFGIDLIIPYVTGYYTTNAVKMNTIVNVGKKKAADQIGGTTTAPVTAIALGTGTTAAAAGDTALETEITTNGGSRGAATVTNTTTTTTGDTEQWQKTFTFTGNLAITEEGLLDNNTSGGIMLARQVFSAVNVVNNDTLQITHKVQVQ